MLVCMFGCVRVRVRVFACGFIGLLVIVFV